LPRSGFEVVGAAGAVAGVFGGVDVCMQAIAKTEVRATRTRRELNMSGGLLGGDRINIRLDGSL
jgi:hypothetical protein